MVHEFETLLIGAIYGVILAGLPLPLACTTDCTLILSAIAIPLTTFLFSLPYWKGKPWHPSKTDTVDRSLALERYQKFIDMCRTYIASTGHTRTAGENVSLCILLANSPKLSKLCFLGNGVGVFQTLIDEWVTRVNEVLASATVPTVPTVPMVPTDILAYKPNFANLTNYLVNYKRVVGERYFEDGTLRKWIVFTFPICMALCVYLMSEMVAALGALGALPSLLEVTVPSSVPTTNSSAVVFPIDAFDAPIITIHGSAFGNHTAHHYLDL